MNNSDGDHACVALLDLESLAAESVRRMAASAVRLVCAESCTGGGLAAAITSVPGASQVFCGSAITYREATKQQWLGVDALTLQLQTAVSQEVTDQMVLGVLRKTGEANISLAVTGHFGPQAPETLDGLVFCSLASRGDDLLTIVHRESWRLEASSRSERGRETVRKLLVCLVQHLRSKLPR